MKGGVKPEGTPEDLLSMETKTMKTLDIEVVDNLFLKSVAPVNTAVDANNAVKDAVAKFNFKIK